MRYAIAYLVATACGLACAASWILGAPEILWRPLGMLGLALALLAFSADTDRH